MASTLHENEASRNFCQKPSKQYLQLLDEAGGDPRATAGEQALRDLSATGGWAPTLDARDARVGVPVTQSPES